MKQLFVLCVLVIVLTVSSSPIYAEPELSMECKKQLDETMNQFTNQVMGDIILSFDLDMQDNSKVMIHSGRSGK
jgi:hypothetical protein